MPQAPRIPPGVGHLQWLGKRVAGWFFRWWCRLEVTGTEHVPLDGPVLLAANHRSMWDIPLHVISCPRPVVFMAKRELYKGPLGWLWHVLGGFPVNRDIADVRAVDTALALLERGDGVGIYPEGKRSKTGEMLPFLRGAAWLALRTGTPIVPSGISGSGGHWWRRKRVRVAFGPPIQVERENNAGARREKAEMVTRELLGEITRLLG